MTIAVFGGTGRVGSALVAVLQRQGADIRVISQSPEKIARLPAGVEGHLGDFDRPESLRAAIAGAGAVFLLVPNGPTETHRGLSALSVVLDASPKRIVYLSSDLSLRAPLVPHAGAKCGIEAALRASEAPHTILRPTYFAQNDLLLRDAIIAGIYPVPCGRMPLARVDVLDVADAAAKALLEGAGTGRSILLSSSEQPNGHESAALWSTALGSPVVFPDEPPDVWASAVRSHMPDWMVFDLELMYRHFQTAGHPVREEDLAEQDLLLPQGTRSYGDFVVDTARTWIEASA